MTKQTPKATSASDADGLSDAPDADTADAAREQPNGEHGAPGTHGADWPERTDEVADQLLDRLRAAFAEATADELHALLRFMPREALQYVMRSLGLTKTAKLNRGMASALLTRLRTRPAVDTVRLMFSPFIYVFDHAHLTAEEWTQFLEGTWEDVVVTLEGASAFAGNLNGLIRFPEPMYRAGLAVTALTSTSWVPALALLALEDSEAGVLYEGLRDDHPDLPVSVRTLRGLLPPALEEEAADEDAADRLARAVAGDLFETIVDDDEVRSTGQNPDDASDPPASGRPAGPVAPDGESLDVAKPQYAAADGTAAMSRPTTGRRQFKFGSLADQSLRMLGAHRLGPAAGSSDREAGAWNVAGWGLVATELQGADIGSLIDNVAELDWETAARTAARVAENLADGGAPAPGDVDELDGFTRRAHALADRLTVHVRYPVDPTAQSLAAAADGLRADDENTRLLRSLIEAEGPDSLAGPVAELRALASKALAGEASDEVIASLAALALLAELGVAQRGSQTREYEQIAVLESAARQSLPPAVQAVLTAAMLGDLTFGSANEAQDSTEPATAPAAPPAEPTAESVDPVGSMHPVADDTDLEMSDSADVGDQQAAMDTHSSECSTEPEASNAPTGEQDSAFTEHEDEEFDLAELEAFLATPAAKSARIKKDDAPKPAVDAAAPSTSAELSVSRTEPRASAMTTPSTGDNPPDLGPDSAPEDHAVVRQLETDLLAAGRFGLASMLHRDPAHAAARRVAAYQAHLTSSTGDLATAFANDQPLITRDALGGDQSGQMLAWAAAARVSVLAPASAAHQILLELAPRVADYPNLTQLGSDLATASLNGAIAVADHGEEVTNHQAASAAVQDAVSAARNLLSVAGQRNIKYLPANHVYQDWMSPAGILGDLLATVVANDPDRALQTQQTIVDLRRNVEKTIDDTVAKILRSGSKGRRIEAGARQTLRKRLEEALDVASDWANATISEREISDWRKGAARAQRPLENLRRSVADIRAGVLDEVAQLRDDCDTNTDSGRLEAAAASAAAAMVIATFAAIDGNPPQGAELSPAWVVRGELLATDAHLDAKTLHPVHSGATADIGASEQELAVDLASQPVATLEDLYLVRARRHEHDLTDVIVTAASRLDEQTAIQLRVEREEAVAVIQAATLDTIEATISNVNVLRREETLPESVWSSLLADLDALKAPQRRDFAAIEAELARVRSVVDKHKNTLMAQARERIEAKAETNELVAQHRQTLLDVVDRGDVAGADEYLEQLTSGAALPDTRDDDRDLRQFFPAVPNLLAADPGLLPDLYAALSGKDVTDPVHELFQIVGRDPTGTTTAGRSAAQAALGAWAPLAGVGSGRKDVEVTGAVKAVLAALGLEFAHGVELDADKPKGRRFGTIREVLPTGGKAMAPALGSHMGGPGGKSLRLLLVWRAETPATILEWLSHQREDQTVLVLYLAGTLTVEQRRALATGARGRPRPVAIVVDAAVLAYLACQPEPSRTALAFATLPFTAASPYRDTPGDTPPEMFYGRFAEQRSVLDLVGSSFVSGGRQLGKSALLRSAQRAFDDGKNRRALFIEIRQIGADGHPEAIWPRLAAELRSEQIAPESTEVGTATALSVSETISTWLRESPDRALLILIDEADNFLHADADDNFTHVGACKQLMTQENRRVKFVFAGLHRTARFESLSNQPLAHMGKPIVVGPLQPQAAQDLITRPMAAMGFTFENARTQTARILAATNSVPSLLQLFGEALIEHMTQKDVEEGPPQRVTDEDISTVLDNKELVTRFREKYILTLNLDHRYQVIVHAVALAAHDNGVDSGLRLSEIAGQCRQYWPAGFADLSVDYLRGLVTECCDLGLLTLDDGRYRMRTPYVLRLLGTAEEVAEVLFDAEDRLTLPSSLDAGSYRESIPGTPHRAPLTARQVGELFSEPGTTRIIVGTEALGASWATAHLVGYAERGLSGEFAVQQVRHWTPESLRSQARMITKPTMLIVDMRAASSAVVAAVLAAEAEAHAATTMPLIIVVLVTPSSLPAWMDDDGRIVELTRVDDAGMRLWCEESDGTFDTPKEWADLGATTGGWPILLERALNPSSSSGSTPTMRLKDLRDRLSDPVHAAAIVASCGLGGDDEISSALAATFDVVAMWTDVEPAPRDDLLDFIADEKDVVGLVKAAGLDDVDTALRTLQSIGAVVTTIAPDSSSALVSTEPVLTAAMRCAAPGSHTDSGQPSAGHSTRPTGGSQ